MRNIGVLGLSMARSEIDNFVQKDNEQTIYKLIKSNQMNMNLKFELVDHF